MKIFKGSLPLIQNSFSQKNDLALASQEQQALISFFSLLYEIDQQNNVSKEYPDAKQTE